MNAIWRVIQMTSPHRRVTPVSRLNNEKSEKSSSKIPIPIQQTKSGNKS